MARTNPTALAAATPPLPSLRERILWEATRAFASRGYSGASLREVAEAAGCTKPALYYHFGNKEQLFLAAVRTEVGAIASLLEDSLRAPGTVRARLTRLCRAAFEHVRDRPVAVALLERVWWGEDETQPAFDLASVQQVHMELVRTLLAEGVATGELRRDLPLEDAVILLVAFLHERAELFLYQGVPIPADAADRLLDLFFRGVAP